MRRRDTTPQLHPPHLAQFVERDWPGDDWRARYDAWTAAQQAYLDEGNEWAGGPLDILYRRMYTRARHYGTPLQTPVSDYFGLPLERQRNGRASNAPEVPDDRATHPARS